MNNGNENGSNPSGNGYYSADNGFACAAAHRGVTEALQEHLNVIVRNEELEIERSHSQIQDDIDGLVEDKERLEEKKVDLQDNTKSLTKEHSMKEVAISELTTKLEAPIDDPPPPDPRIAELKTAIDEKSLVLEERQIERVKIETALEAPTAAELNPPPVDKNPVSLFTAIDKKFTKASTSVLVGLIFYLFIFYGSVGDRTFTKGVGTIEEKQHIIVPHAFFTAVISWPPNLFVAVFPFIFLALAIAFYYYHEHSESNRTMYGILGATFLIDLIIAIKISMQIWKFKGEVDKALGGAPPSNGGAGPPPSNGGAEYSFWNFENLIEIASVLFLGFGVSVLLGYVLTWVMRVRNGGRQSEQLERLKRAEQNDRLVLLAALTEGMKHLQNRIDDLKREREACERDAEEALRQHIEARNHPMQVEIARLNTEKEALQNQMNELNEQIESIQKEINQCEAKIEGLLKDQRERIIDIKKLEAQANEFVSGWCRYVVQNKTELPTDVATQVKDIQDLTDKTLETYKDSLAAI